MFRNGVFKSFTVYILYLGVSGEEVVDVPNHSKFAVHVRDVFVDEGEVFAREDWGAEEQEAEGVGGILIHQDIRVGKVAERFTHFATVIPR